jgi:hypothetical protein
VHTPGRLRGDAACRRHVCRDRRQIGTIAAKLRKRG